MKHKTLFLPLLAAAILALGACGPAPEPEQSLEERVVARWQHMIERDFKAAWAYYSPGFRQGTPQEDFARDMERRPIRWHGVEFISLECQEEVCRASVEVQYQPIGAPGEQSQMTLERVIEEQWVRQDDEWWFSAG